MSTVVRTVWMLVLAISAPSIARAQTPAVENRDTATAPVRVLREIKDPHTGETWRLFPNQADPAGPGQLVRFRDTSCPKVNHEGEKEKPVIRRGDRVVVEEHSAVMEAYLEARALEPAQIGSLLNLRLKVGGKVVRAVAIAPGRAEVRR